MDSKIVYSSDGSSKNLVKKGAKKRADQEVIPEQCCLKLRIEKKRRGGKSVTVIYDILDNPPYFKKLLKEIKNYCGTGGSYHQCHLEIQGDQRNKVSIFLQSKGFKVKGSR